MDVTSDNFHETLPMVKESIMNADFIAFDTEFSGKVYWGANFSGLTVGIEDKGHDYDMVEDRYQKIKHNC